MRFTSTVAIARATCWCRRGAVTPSPFKAATGSTSASLPRCPTGWSWSPGSTTRPTPRPTMIELIDSHCHLEPKDFTDDGVDVREQVIARAHAAGVVELICVGSGASLSEVANAVSLAESHPRLWAAVGIHPHDAARLPEGALDEIERLAANHPKVVAVGETGL